MNYATIFHVVVITMLFDLKMTGNTSYQNHAHMISIC